MGLIETIAKPVYCRGLSQHHGSGCSKPPNDGCIAAGRRCAKWLKSGGSRQTRNVHEVLENDGHTMKLRARSLRLALCIECARFVQSLRVYRNHRIDLGTTLVVSRDAIQVKLN